jgi:exoribonuclease-2
MPGEKIPMQPDAVIEAFSLDAGRPVPALSLYVTANPLTGEILGHESRLERVVVRENLRHNLLDEAFTEEALADTTQVLPYNDWIRPLWQLALALAKQREQVRGKPENNNRVEYSFYVDGDPNDPNTPVRILPRRRNAPLDRLVAEYMILANSTWGGLLASCGLPGIYRSQQMGRVRMSTQALPHEAIGVPQYAWCTSPLRRYVDLVNQWQLIAAIEHGVSAPLVAPFKPRDAPTPHVSIFKTPGLMVSDKRAAPLAWRVGQGLSAPRAMRPPMSLLMKKLVVTPCSAAYLRWATLRNEFLRLFL